MRQFAKVLVVPQFETGSGPDPRPATHFEYTVVGWPGGCPGGGAGGGAAGTDLLFKLRHYQSFCVFFQKEVLSALPLLA
jgi:hypothetical protein